MLRMSLVQLDLFNDKKVILCVKINNYVKAFTPKIVRVVFLLPGGGKFTLTCVFVQSVLAINHQLLSLHEIFYFHLSFLFFPSKK